ncbi:hypothetical protein K2173_028321 [Erythroxylum novogranatense]|uniref:DUF4378 domain-containing protein n=1 Tax=Erythroxylum novogranatense TaxID=1862640 RepID=A0AAV8U4V4_9ROSI|nr:hypothetical protein K2173_028321 [Erythroxylum novogranatense]
MAAKLLHSLADDSPDLKKQIGCMTGIFQIFDRQHTLTGRRFIHKRLPPGDSHCSNGSSEVEPVNEYSRHTAADVNLSKFEKQRLSTESSRASFSSSCSSSLSSMDCNRAATQEASSFDRIIFSDNPSKDVVISQPSTSPCLGRQSLDLREVVKDSMYREARGLSLKTAGKEEAMHQGAKPKDSPRPFHFPSSLGGPNGVRTGKQNTSDDLTLKESLHVLAKQQEAPRYYRETREHQRSSYESKDAPRFSYDGREMNRLSFESQDTLKSTLKLPRLSLDSILISVGNSNPSYCFPVRDLQNCGSSNEEGYDPEQSLGSQKRPPSVVARLMGLDSLPESASTNHSHLNNISPAQLSHSSLRPLKTYNLSMPVRIPKSPRSFMKDPISPRLKNPDLVMKPISRLPIEPAPWKQMDSSRGSYKPEFKAPKAPAKPPSFPSLYTDIEKRLKDLEFKQSGKDRRALKQILEAMQAKGLLQTGKEEQGLKIKKPRDTESKHTSPNHKAHLSGQRSQRSNIVGASTSRGSDFVKTCESPIVIMKPSKLIEKSGSTSSVIPIDELSGLDKVPTGGHADNRKGSISSHNTGERDLRISQRDTSINSSDKKVGVRNVKQSSTRPQLSRDSTVKSRGSVSPRLQLMKIEMEKRSRPPTPPPDPNSTRKLSNRQPTESGSPGRKHRIKSTKVPSSDDQLSQISNESRTSSHQGDDVSLQSENMTIFDLKSDIEITSIEQSNLVNEGQSPFLKAACCLVSDSMERPVSTSEEDGMSAEPAMVAPEHPSPVSVLDVSVYRDDAPSPVKQIPDMPTVDSAIDFRGQKSEDTWTPTDKFLSDSMVSGLSSEINRKKLQNIENLVEKLRRLNSTHDEASTDYIASLCENKNPDHRYISEILLASGLLLRDLGSGLTTFQVHPSGHPINPELFLVLEQTKSSSLAWKEEYSPRESMTSKKNLEKSQRQLIFDVVNEILLKKLALLEPCLESWLKSYKLARKTLSAQKLLKELCSEIEQLQVKKWECSSEEEEDGLKGILWEDEVQRWEGWTDFNAEVSGLVLDVERLIFKDLVDEIVRGEAARARPKQQARRRQLFANAT